MRRPRLPGKPMPGTTPLPVITVMVWNDAREALNDQGFGIITEIDVSNTFKQKLDVDSRP